MFRTNCRALFSRALRLTLAGTLSVSACALTVHAADPNDFLVYNYDFQNNGIVELPGRLYVPTGYNPALKYPIVIFFHGNGQRGSNNTNQVNGNIDNLLAAAKSRGFFLFAPQAPLSVDDWTNVYTNDAMRQLSNVTRDYSIDPARIYATGLSMGGAGCWNAAIRFRDAVAASAPICAPNPYVPLNVADLAGIPVWAFHAADDGTVNISSSRNNVNAIRAAGGLSALTWPPAYTGGIYDSNENNLRYREYSSGGHGIWGTVYNTSALYDWMLAQINPLEEATLQPGETMLFDFGNTQVSTDTLGQSWNTSAFGYHNTLSATFHFAKKSTGQATSVSLDVSQAFSGHTTTGSSALYQSGIGTDGWATAANGTGIILIRGLLPGNVYDLEIYAATTTANRYTRYIANGVQKDLNASVNTIHTETLSGVVADANGRIQLSVAAVPGSGSTVGVINDMKLTAIATAVVTPIFSQNFNASSTLASYISATPDSGQFNDISAETDGGTWSIASSRLQIARTGLSTNGAGFTRYTGPVASAPDVLEFNFKVSLSGVNTFNTLATLGLGNFTAFQDYNNSYPSASTGNILTFKGKGNGFWGISMNGTLGGNHAANGTEVSVTWRVNQSAVSQSYVGEDSATHTISSGCSDVWMNGVKTHSNVARSYGSATAKLGGYRMQVTTSQATTFTFDDIVTYDSLPQ